MRELLGNKKQQLAHWAKMYNWGLKTMPVFVLAGTASAAAAYAKTKDNLWVIGGSVLFAIIPYTFALMMKTNNYLELVLKTTYEPEVAESEKETVVRLMKKWVSLHRVRGLLALIAGGIFIYANHKARV